MSARHIWNFKLIDAHPPASTTLQDTTAHCNKLHYTATHCNTWPELRIFAGSSMAFSEALCKTYMQSKEPYMPSRKPSAFEVVAPVRERASERESERVFPLESSPVWRNCNALQHAAPHCNTLQRPATHDTNSFLSVSNSSSLWQHCNTMQHNTTLCNTLQHSALRCTNPLQSSPVWQPQHPTALYLKEPYRPSKEFCILPKEPCSTTYCSTLQPSTLSTWQPQQPTLRYPIPQYPSSHSLDVSRPKLHALQSVQLHEENARRGDGGGWAAGRRCAAAALKLAVASASEAALGTDMGLAPG